MVNNILLMLVYFAIVVPVLVVWVESFVNFCGGFLNTHRTFLGILAPYQHNIFWFITYSLIVLVTALFFKHNKLKGWKLFLIYILGVIFLMGFFRALIPQVMCIGDGFEITNVVEF